MNASDLPLGVVRGMSFADYLRVPALSNSGLKRLAKSPAHFKAGDSPEDKPSDALRRGSLLHTLVLEPDAVPSRYRVKPEGMSFITKEGKAWRDNTPSGVEIVTAAEWLTATRQADAIRALPDVAELLGAGWSEVSFFWLDPVTGALCKGRADWVFSTGAGVILLDLKTTEDAASAAFSRSCARYGYHTQAPWYSDGWTEATGEPVLGFVFAAVEGGWPHAAAAYMLTDEAMDKGRSECRRLTALYAECQDSGRWPGYSDSIQPLSLPAWAI